MSKKKQTPLTVELFHQEITPVIDEMMDEKIKTYRDEVLDFKVEVLGEIKNLREEVTVVNHQYNRMDKRVTRVERKLNIKPSLT